MPLLDTGTRKATILVIDDEAVLLTTVAEALEAQGYRVVTAASGREGLERAVQAQPDLILLDIVMPGMDGFAVLGRLKTEETTRRIPVIVLTAKGETSAIVLSQQLRAADHVIKPVILDELLTVIRRYLPLRLS